MKIIVPFVLVFMYRVQLIFNINENVEIQLCNINLDGIHAVM